MRGVLLTIALAINYFSLFYVLVISSIYFIQLVSAAAGLRKYTRSLRYTDYERFVDSSNMVPISVLVPAYNEAATIADNTRNLLSLDYPEYEVIVINDGSSDDTMDILQQNFHLIPVSQPFKKSLQTKLVRGVYRSALYPRLLVLDKENGGKADALNAGINASLYPIFVSIDADSILENSSLIKIVYSFMTDPTAVAVGGIVRIGSGCEIINGKLTSIRLARRPLLMLQTNEYLRAFLTGRIGFNQMGMLLIISGAFGAFKKQAVIDAGGYTVGCVGEDMELIVKLHKLMRDRKTPYSIRFLPDPVCWTQPPERLRDLKKQRKRWQIGLIDTLRRHRDMAFNPRYGRVGTLCLPYFWIFEFFGPVFEALGYLFVPISWILGIVNVRFMLSFFLVAVLYGTMLSVGALLLEENTFRKYPHAGQLLRLFFYAIVDNLGYRQLNTIFKVEAMFTFRKNRSNWGTIQRRKFAADSANNKKQHSNL
jgi:cellulose synthase/poly-beta-1,6-N-acetylglucosamine synthase-like glycosyltransferase